jgi:DNA polymerase (family 10)
MGERVQKGGSLFRSDDIPGSPMSTNAEVAEVFRAIADLLDLQGTKFKPEAYRRAARSIESLGEDLRAVAGRGQLDQIPGVGDALREKIVEYLADGHVTYYERLRAEFPPGLIELMRVPGIGPKTTGRLYAELHVDSPSALRAAIDAGRLIGMAGFGERKIEKLRQSLVSAPEDAARRTPLRAAWGLARSITRELADRTPVLSIDVAGSLRRRRETVGDLDILATSSDPRATIGAFVALAGVQEVVLQGDTKATVRHAPGIQVDLRVVEPDCFGAALQYFTGSKDHNVRLRTLARDRGLKINEYGVFRGEERIAGRTEEEVYGTLGIPWIPPELRENQGEIEAALAGNLPRLVELAALKGELHRHISEETPPSALAALRREAARRGLEYVGLVVRSPDLASVPPGPLDAVRRARQESTAGSPRLLVGVEVPLEALESQAEPPEGVDYLIGSPHGPGAGPPPRPPRHPPLFLAHVGIGASGGEEAGSSLGGWLSWSRAAGAALEVTPDGAADGLDSGAVRRAVEAGGTIVVSADPAEGASLDALELAVGIARRGSASAEAVLNARAGSLAGHPPPGRRARERARKD